MDNEADSLTSKHKITLDGWNALKINTFFYLFSF